MAEAVRNEVADGFSGTAKDYDSVVRFNIEGARRLIASLPPGDHARVLDVGCGTGFASLAMVERFAPELIAGVDPAAGMLEAFREKLGAIEGTAIELHEADVLAMPVEDGSFDAVICSMAFHWSRGSARRWPRWRARCARAATSRCSARAAAASTSSGPSWRASSRRPSTGWARST